MCVIFVLALVKSITWLLFLDIAVGPHAPIQLQRHKSLRKVVIATLLFLHGPHIHTACLTDCCVVFLSYQHFSWPYFYTHTLFKVLEQRIQVSCRF